MFSLMKKKRKPQSLDSLTAEVFSKKGLSTKDYAQVAQFELDFMILVILNIKLQNI